MKKLIVLAGLMVLASCNLKPTHEFYLNNAKVDYCHISKGTTLVIFKGVEISMGSHPQLRCIKSPIKRK